MDIWRPALPRSTVVTLSSPFGPSPNQLPAVGSANMASADSSLRLSDVALSGVRRGLPG